MADSYTLMQPETPWEERFGWYHYSGRQVYHFSDADLDGEAQRYADTGITTVILFGAHFRFSFWAYWSDIEDFIARFTRAFHKKGIKVVEHHSSHLTYQPVEPEVFWPAQLADGTWLGGFPNLRETSQSNPVLGGAHLDDFAQIDGSTGKPCLSSYIHTEGRDVHWIFRHYNGNAHCFNHPAYEKAYWGHVKNIIEKAHVDGMMNDDVQWFGGGNACACAYCRKKFKEETGYDLPDPAHWQDFFEHYERPDYIAWKQFKKRQSGAFHYRMDARYKSIGFKPLRPAYCAEVLPFDTTCYGFEPARGLWDYIFQECCCIISQSYVCYAAEAVHRYAMAARLHKPSMALLYPATKDSTYAAWALCRSWGQLFTGTNSRIRELFDKPYRAFEKAHKELYRSPVKRADVSFYFSETTRDYTHKDAPQVYMKPYMSYLESAYVSGISCDMTFRQDTAETMAAQRCIILPYIEMISDEEAEQVRRYAENGGTVIVLGPFAGKKEDGSLRPLPNRLALLGMGSTLREGAFTGTETLHGQTFENARSRVLFDQVQGEVIARGEDGTPLAVAEAVGKGRVIYHPADVSLHPIQPAVWPKGDRTPVDRSFLPDMKRENGRLLSLLTGEKFLHCDREDVMASVFETEGGTALHLVNTAGMLPAEDTDASIFDPIAQFCDGAAPIHAPIHVRLSHFDRTPARVVLYTPERPEEAVDVPFAMEGGALTLTVPADTFAGYALLHIQ